MRRAAQVFFQSREFCRSLRENLYPVVEHHGRVAQVVGETHENPGVGGELEPVHVDFLRRAVIEQPALVASRHHVPPLEAASEKEIEHQAYDRQGEKGDHPGEGPDGVAVFREHHDNGAHYYESVCRHGDIPYP